jgi:uncharacterized Zn finger protein
MSIANLDETTLRYHTTDKSFQRGEAYYQQGAVVNISQRGNCLCGEVEGNNVEPYRVTIQFDTGGVTETQCTCEYSLEGWCKHIVAVALTSIRTPGTIHQRDKLARIRLEILNLQERYPEYLNLARAEDLVEEYLVLLAQLGRIDEVMAASIRIKDARQALAVAKVLREQEALAQALLIATAGLELPVGVASPGENRLSTTPAEDRFFTISQSPLLDRYRYELADWTSELAQGLSDLSTALSARITAFKLRPSMRGYQQVKTLAGDTWQTLQPNLLKHLRTMDNWSHAEAKVQIFLHENAIDDAIATVNDGYGRGNLMQLVMDAAIAHRPEWVIAKAIRPAEDIMNRGKAESYEDAVNWLTRARAAYRQSGRQAEWDRYLAQLIATHGRKRKLMGLIEDAKL